jgi:2-keto-4-pentenoate hydratase
LEDGRLSPRRAEAIASQLYDEILSAGARQVGWKLIATDERGQAWLGTPRPLSAPVFSSSVIPDGAVIRLDELVAPRVELEIGFQFSGDSVRPLPCIEVADSRFPDWGVTASEAIADFALQGFMIFGQPTADVSSVDMTLLHDGNSIAAGSRTIAAASAAVSTLGEQQLAIAAARGFTVAAGSVVGPLPLAAGSWHADFGLLGTLAFEVAL